jgi:hypothetical protein
MPDILPTTADGYEVKPNREIIPEEYEIQGSDDEPPWYKRNIVFGKLAFIVSTT